MHAAGRRERSRGVPPLGHRPGAHTDTLADAFPTGHAHGHRHTHANGHAGRHPHIDLSPSGWHDLAWSGADATDPGTALACIAGDYDIAYAWEGPTTFYKRYVEGCAIPGICNMAALNKYDTLWSTSPPPVRAA